MIALPERNNKIYKEIEDFEDYEYINCIAYEMAIRNSEIKQLIKKFNSMPINYDRYENSYYTEEYYEIENELEEKYLIDWCICRHIEKSYNEHIEIMHKEFSEKMMYLNVNRILHKIDYEELMDKKELIELESISKKIHDDFYKNIEKFKLVFEDILIESEKVHSNSKPLFTELVSDGLGSITEKKEEEKAIIEDRNFLRFNRPRLTIPKEVNKNIDLKINLNLPIEELKAYIEKIKNEFDKDILIVKSPLELLGENLDKADNNPLIHKRTKKIDKIKMADIFFIYDSIKVGVKKAQVISLLNNYHYEKSMKLTNFDSKTLNNYLSIAIEYIDNLKYKELITGVKK